jgi:VanZ family protein
MSPPNDLPTLDAASSSRYRPWMLGLLFAYLVVLTYALLSPDPFAWLRTPSEKPPTDSPFYLAWLKNDKVRHCIAYAILTALLFASTRWNAMTVFAAAAFHGGGMEILQQWFPPRSMEFLDWIADLGGALAVVLVHRLLSRRRAD